MTADALPGAPARRPIRVVARGLHTRLAWVAGLVAMAWAATGFLHPIMSWTAPRPAVQAPPAQTLPLSGLIAPGPLLAQAGLAETRQVRLADVEGSLVWFAATPEGGGRIALDARTGAPAPEAERTHAIALARHYAGLADTPVRSARLITAFSTDYPSVNRLLPVWEVTFDTPDALALYVDTGMDRLAAVTNTPRRILLSVFQNVHTLKFLERWEPVRLAVITLLIGTVMAMTIAGAAMLLSGRGRGMRRVHRALAWAALVPTLMFTGSGLFHLFMTNSLSPRPEPTASLFRTADLPPPPRAGNAMMRFGALAASAGPSGPLWRVEAAGTGHYLGGAAGLTDADHARALAGAAPDAAVSRVERFGGDYGFINKRLPVWRVETADGPVFVDVREGLIAASGVASPLARMEDWTFDTLHKWHFLDPLGRRNRDYGTMAATLVILTTAGFGLALAARRRRPSSNQGA